MVLLEASEVTREGTTAEAKSKIVFGIRRGSSAGGCGLEFVSTEDMEMTGLPKGSKER